MTPRRYRAGSDRKFPALEGRRFKLLASVYLGPGWWAGLIQLVCGLLVMVGLFTRPAALLASGSMAYAYFTVHQPNGVLPIQNGGVTPALYAWSFLAIAALGAGPWSVDALLRRRGSVEQPAPETVPA
jgi:putative oxidoreductase